MSDLPPSYNDIQASPPPEYTLPETFSIGHQRVPLLVQPQQLKGHLSMLRAFYNLRTIVESDQVSKFPMDVRAMEPEKRWGWFVNIAVERFERWCTCLGGWCSVNVELALPPIDVLMVWHAYLLNPIWYAEDTDRVPVLDYLPLLTEYLAANIGRPDLLITDSPHPDRLRNWEHRTNTPWDPLYAATVMSDKDIWCPQCEKQTPVSFLRQHGLGYAQSNFTAYCTSCGRRINKGLLGLYKFAKDIVRTEGFLPGTLHSPYERHDTGRATLIRERVKAAAKLPKSNSLAAADVMAMLTFDPAFLSRIITGQIQRRIGRRILSAYTDDRPFSIDLVGAVLRQSSFVRKMADLGWTDPDFFAGEAELVVLQHCVARYHAFLGLMADAPGSFFVPTLDIDLTWHTHQLRGKHYHAECKRVVGRYIDHDDKVDEDHLATGFDITCRAWTDRYGLPYTYCGCPLPGKTLGQRLRNALSLYHRRTRGELDVLRPPRHAAAGTHASDHNAVYPVHNHKAAEKARERRRQKAERRRHREMLAAQERNGGRNRLGLRDDAERLPHGLAFFYPIPLWIGVPYESCISAPFVVDNGACATGMGGCMSACGGAACGSGGQCGGGGNTCGGGGSTCGGGGGSNCGGGGCGGGCGGG